MLLFDDFALEPAPVCAGTPALPPEPAEPPRAAGGLVRIVRPLATNTRGVLVALSGEAEACAMILRTASMRPGQGYRAELPVTRDWQTVNLLLSDFTPIGGVLRRSPRPETLHSYAILPEDGPVNLTRVRFY
ncbi:hypothetical protein [Thalassovita sp.]|jgi:hypothetical protein|uniref:hypothetical protein n=1 Tax=Thalassovita sp. TaxID=1979401 RepID=UPI003B5AB3B1